MLKLQYAILKNYYVVIRKCVSSSNHVDDGNRLTQFRSYCHFAPYYDNQNYIKLMAHKIQLEVAATITKAIIIQILNND